MLERVQKIMSNNGVCSRRKAEELISQGKVRVNNKVIKLGDKADPGKDRIFVSSREVIAEKKIYIMLNKPKNYVTTLHEKFYPKIAIDLINIPQRVYPVGRIDKDASGLLLFTNDGDFANKIMHPRYEINKTYFVKLDKPIEKQVIAKVAHGIRLEDGFVKAVINKVESNEVRITVHEGRNKLVKRIFNEFGYRVVYLKRVEIGKLRLDVKEGRWRFLTNQDIKKIFYK